MLRNILTLILAAGLLWGTAAFCEESAYEWQSVRSGRILVEFNQPPVESPPVGLDGKVTTGLDDLDRLLGEIGATKLEQPLLRYQPDIYLITFDARHSVEEVMTLLRGWSGTREVWPCVLLPWDTLAYVPDDMLLPSQWHHDAIESPAAWGIYRGSDTVQVAIVDGGVNYVHPDLAENIWINAGEDLNGNGIIEPSDWDSLDNDANGYIDDFWGWDWINLDSSAVWPGEDPGPPDNDPSDFDGHGTHCAGDACAATDNSIGVAGPGFGCQIMALRAGYLSASGQGYVDLLAATQAVYYAVNMGAEVISMSFGGPGAVAYFQAALQFASDAGLVLVAAAGNESTSTISYPAGYEFVIAVAATAPGDVLADFTSYGTWITLCAPGEGILSTVVEGYSNMSGTSMATPITAGAAALVKSLKPEWNSTEVGMWLAYTADNIDAQNPGYIGMMGGGRLNVAKAVDLYVTIDSVWADNGLGGERLYFDQQGSLFVRYHKYYGDATNVILNVSSPNPRVHFSQSTHTIGTILEGQTGDNSAEPFVISVDYGGYDYELVEFKGHFSGDGFEFTQLFEVPVGRGQVLIIDADQNQEERTSSYYEGVLEELGYTWETWRRADRAQLGGELSEYEAIIHFSGTAESNIFPAGDWDDLETYLENGGNLIVSGQNVAQDLFASQPSVLSDILHVAYQEPHSNILTVRGIEGNPITEGMYLVMAGSGGAWNQSSMDVVNALPGAEPFFVYRLEVPEELAGVRVQDGLGDLFYCAFGIEGINDSTSSGNTKTEVLGMMFEQFGISAADSPVKSAIPSKISLLPPYPNPFNSQLRISYNLPQPSSLYIVIFDILGRQIIEHHLDHAPEGSGEWIWSADPNLSSGIYLISLKASGKTLHQKAVYLK